jgi:hypothetical protein
MNTQQYFQDFSSPYMGGTCSRKRCGLMPSLFGFQATSGAGGAVQGEPELGNKYLISIYGAETTTHSGRASHATVSEPSDIRPTTMRVCLTTPRYALAALRTQQWTIPGPKPVSVSTSTNVQGVLNSWNCLLLVGGHSTLPERKGEQDFQRIRSAGFHLR